MSVQGWLDATERRKIREGQMINTKSHECQHCHEGACVRCSRPMYVPPCQTTDNGALMYARIK